MGGLQPHRRLCINENMTLIRLLLLTILLLFCNFSAHSVFNTQCISGLGNQCSAVFQNQIQSDIHLRVTCGNGNPPHFDNLDIAFNQSNGLYFYVFLFDNSAEYWCSFYWNYLKLSHTVFKVSDGDSQRMWTLKVTDFHAVIGKNGGLYDENDTLMQPWEYY